jgi:ribosomal silencing factor RsfS
MLQLSDNVKSKICSNEKTMQQATKKRNFADVILIAMSKNQEHVKAIAGNS